ncbi:MAG: hypothetical protein ABW004_13735, partial [Aeromicrobium sp.]
MKGRVVRRAVALAGAIALAVTGAVAVTAPASAATGPNIAPGATGSITIHKHEQPLESGTAATGQELTSALPGPIQGVVFSVTPVTNVDLRTNAGWTSSATFANGLAASADQ